MPVQRTIRSYRTTETEKALGKTSKYVLIGYLKSVKDAVLEAEVVLAKSEKERKKKIARDKAEVEAWNTKFRNLSAKIIRAELRKNKEALPVPSGSREPKERTPLDALSISIEAEHQRELENLLKEQPSYSVYWGAGLIPLSDKYDYYGKLAPDTLRWGAKHIDSLIADLESRTNPDVYTAQIMEIRNNVEQTLSRYGSTPQVGKKETK